MKTPRFTALAFALAIGAAFSMPLTIASPVEAATKKPMHSASASVKSAQEALNKNGASLTADGKIGPKTVSAIKSFQKSHGLKTTGKLDTKTKSALNS
jgi:peptidoglycan hydrolase-like protein with peptidoglycan-binding domain